jgi:hypothetical protein
MLIYSLTTRCKMCRTYYLYVSNLSQIHGSFVLDVLLQLYFLDPAEGSTDGTAENGRKPESRKGCVRTVLQPYKIVRARTAVAVGSYYGLVYGILA